MDSIAIKSTTIAAWQARLELIAALHMEEPLGDADCITGKYIARIAEEMRQELERSPAGMPVVVEFAPQEQEPEAPQAEPQPQPQPVKLSTLGEILKTQRKERESRDMELMHPETAQTTNTANNIATPAMTEPLKSTGRGYEWSEEETDAIKDAVSGAQAIKFYRAKFPLNTCRSDAAIKNRWGYACKGMKPPAGNTYRMKGSKKPLVERFPKGAEATVVRAGSLYYGKVGKVKSTNDTQVLLEFAGSGEMWVGADDVRRV